MPAIDTSNPLDSTGATAGPDLKPPEPGAPTPPPPNPEQPKAADDSATTAMKRLEHRMDQAFGAAYFQGQLGSSQHPPLSSGPVQSNIGYADPNGSGSLAPTKTGGTGAPPASGPACTESADVKTALTDRPQGDPAKDDFAAAQKAIEQGDYSKARDVLNDLLQKGPHGIASNEDLPDDDKKLAETMKDQLGFLSNMQKAGVKNPCYPPTEPELVDYFKKLKDRPDDARKAFENYTQSFDVHPVNVKGNNFDISYSHEIHSVGDVNITTNVPRGWSDVAGGSRTVSSKDYPQYVAKQMNDCKGYAYKAQELLGAAGFKVEHFVDASPSKFGDGHMMLMLSHAGEKKLTLTSNDRVFTGNDPTALAKQGFAYAAGGSDNVTGKEHYFTGSTGVAAEIQQGLFQDNPKRGKFDELPR